MTQTDCEPCRVSRRAVLKGVGAATTVAVAVPALGTNMAFASTNADRRGDVIVNVFLRGAMDGLSVVVPRTENAGADHYLAARPTVAVDPGEALPLTGDFGLHPAMSALLPLWQRGDLALIPTAGFPLNNRSHFTVQRQMDLGSGNTTSGPTGWLARYLDHRQATDPIGIRAADLPRGEGSLTGSNVSITMGSVERFDVAGFRGSGNAAQEALRHLHAGPSTIIHDRAVQALDALDTVANADITPPANGAVYPTSGRGRVFGEQMRQIAQLIRADVGLEAAATRANLGWDTHGNMGTFRSGNMRDSVEGLAEVLAAFATDLGPLMGKVTIVLMTEFGRTFRENGGRGTDHGRASTMFAIGGGIRGGLYGDWPGLGPTDIAGNALRVTVDYRSVLLDVLEHRLGATAVDAILPGFTIDPAERLNLADPIAPVEEVVEEAPDDAGAVVVPPAPEETDPSTGEEAPAPPVSPGLTWRSPDGGVIRLEVPAAEGAPRRAEVEELRLLLGGESASYVAATLDNTDGTADLRAPIVVVDDGGTALTHRSAWVVVELWATNDVDAAFVDRTTTLIAGLESDEVAPAGETRTVLLAAVGEPVEALEVRLVNPEGDEVVLTSPAEGAAGTEVAAETTPDTGTAAES